MIDPKWAWSPFQPTAKRPWTKELAAHLYRRAGFGATAAQLETAVQMQPAELVAQLVQGSDESVEFSEQMDSLAETALSGGNLENLAPPWLYRMLKTSHQLREKLTLFWHGHFATSAEKVAKADLMLQQNQLLRRYALGDFTQLVQEISRDPAMLVYLDSADNRKSHPNENYARELMELFCLGEGHYSEQDVRELARCFTGWEIRRNQFRFNRYQHDFGAKKVLDTSGKLDGEQAVQVVLKQPTAPRFIAQKLVQFLVMDEPQATVELIQPLADQLRRDDMQIAGTVQRILGSQLFFSTTAVGRKIRSPVEFAVGLLRSLDGLTNVNALSQQLRQLGQGLFFPPSVKGWDGGRSWINSSTLVGRANLVYRVLRDEQTSFAAGSLTDVITRQGISQPLEIVNWLCQLLVAVPLAEPTRDQLVAILEDKSKGKLSDRLTQTIYTMAALPEFHLN